MREHQVSSFLSFEENITMFDKGMLQMEEDKHEVNAEEKAIAEEGVTESTEILTENQKKYHLRDRNTLKSPARLEYDQHHEIACIAAIEEPNTFEEAISGHDKDQWTGAMKEEINSLEKNET